MQEILKIANNIKIFGIGEATHGQHKINSYRSKVFRNLVQKCNYNVLVLEEQYSTCQEVNQYIKSNIDTKLEIIMQSFMWPWKSVQMYDLINWMREYNKTHNNILEFRGIDIQFDSGFSLPNDKLNAYVKKIIKKYQKLKEQNTTNFRDKNMFDLFMKFYESNKRYFIWAHNAHLEKNNNDHSDMTFFGTHLYDKFKNDYFVIGNAFFKGSFRGLNPDSGKMEIAAIDVKKNKLADGLYFYNNKFKNKQFPEGGSAASRIDPMKYIWFVRYGSRFDGLLVIDNEMPIRLIENVGSWK
jgi:erythromycin esterase-like protein